jgi:hypothetical protein
VNFVLCSGLIQVASAARPAKVVRHGSRVEGFAKDLLFTQLHHGCAAAPLLGSSAGGQQEERLLGPLEFVMEWKLQKAVRREIGLDLAPRRFVPTAL